MATLYNISEHYQNILDACTDGNANSDLVVSALSVVDGELIDKVKGGIALSANWLQTPEKPLKIISLNSVRFSSDSINLLNLNTLSR